MRHRQTKGAETDRPILPPPHHIPTLPFAVIKSPPRILLLSGVKQTFFVEERTSDFGCLELGGKADAQATSRFGLFGSVQPIRTDRTSSNASDPLGMG